MIFNKEKIRQRTSCIPVYNCIFHEYDNILYTQSSKLYIKTNTRIKNYRMSRGFKMNQITEIFELSCNSEIN